MKNMSFFYLDILNSVLKGRVKSRNINTCIISFLKHSSNILYNGTQR